MGKPAGKRQVPVIANSISDRYDAKPDIAGRRRGCIRTSRSNTVAIAIRVVAEKRTATQGAVATLQRVQAPFPHVAADIEQAETIALTLAGVDGCWLPTWVGRVGKLPSEYVASGYAIGACKFVTPGESSTL